MSPRNLINTQYKDIRLAIQNYISLNERVVTAERAKFLSVIQGAGESDDDLLARLREEASYCDFDKLKTSANPEEELVKIKFISGLRDPEAKLRLPNGIKAKPAMSVTEVTESLQFRSHAMAFASSSSGNKPFTVKEEVGFNFKKTFRKPSEKFTANKSNMCSRCGGKPHSTKPCFSTINRITFAKKIFLQSKNLHHRRSECFIQKNKSLAYLRHGNISR